MQRRVFLKKICSPLEEQKGGLFALPYLENVDYKSHCQDCQTHHCVESCEEGIIVITSDGVARVDLGRGGCTFCEACVQHCDSVLMPFNIGYKKIYARIELAIDQCLAWNKTLCYSCKDACEARAIVYQGLFYPEIQENCTHCGFCALRCPTQAISLFPIMEA